MLKDNELIKKTLQLIAVAILAKGLGFIREVVLANYYGASYISDVFVAVQNIPSIIFTVFGIAITTGFIPIYTELEVKKGKDIADKFANNIFNIFLLISVILSILGIIFSNQLVKLFAGGFSGDTLKLCNRFAKIIMPTSVAIILVYVYNAYLQIEEHFNQNSLMNIPYNVIQIIFIALSFYIGNVDILAIGLLIASYSQLMYLRVLIKRKTKFKHEKVLDFKDKNIRNMLIIVGPLFISTGINQLNSIIDRSLASGLVEGSVSALNYSSEVSNIITQVIILSLTTILYPKMTKIFMKDNSKEKNRFTEKYISIVWLLVLPLSVLIFVFSKEIVRILFARGAFSEENVEFVSASLRVYAVGIVGASFRDVLNKIFYSMKNTITPMVNGCIAVLVNIILNLILVKKYEYIGLAFATSFSSIVCTILLFIQLIRKMNGINIKKIIFECMKISLATLVMIIFLIVFNKLIVFKIDIIQCIIGGILSSMIYACILLILKENAIYNLVKSKKESL